MIIDPGIAALVSYGLEEERNGSIRKLVRDHVLPVLAPHGHVFMAWHVGHQNKKRGRGQSDLYGWARLVMLYSRQDDGKAILTATKANRHQDAYQPLTVRVDGLGRLNVERSDDSTVHIPRESNRRIVMEHVKANPGTTGSQIAKATGIAKSTVTGHLNALDGQIVREKHGREVRLYPNDQHQTERNRP